MNPIALLLVIVSLTPALAGMRKEMRDPEALMQAWAMDVPKLESMVRSCRTAVQLHGAQLKALREMLKITDPNPDQEVVITPAKGRLGEVQTYLEAKERFLRAKATLLRAEEMLESATARR